MNTFFTHAVSLWVLCMAGVVHASFPVYADGDLAPLGAPDGLINTADYLIASRITLGQVSPTGLELSHGDIYPTGVPDGVINIQDLLLLQQRVLGQAGIQYVENVDLFVDGPAMLSATVDGNTAYTTVTVGGWTGPGAVVVSDPYFTDPGDPANTVWYVSISDGSANVYLGTADLSAHGLLDSGFDLSGGGLGQLVFDIKVNSLSPGATLTVKIDSGYPDLGQVVLTPAQYSVGSWRRVVIDIADLLADPGPGAGLDLENVVNAFVLEVISGDADFYLDNIFISRACEVVGDCRATINTKALPSGGYESPLSYPGYALVWNDEFDGTALNPADWTHEIGTGTGGWGNNEVQYYRAENASVADGLLTIEAREENYGGRNYTSSRLVTQDKRFFRYGKIDIRAALPRGQGLWPALWMLGQNFASVGWPASGEIDIMEMIGGSGRENTIYGTVHWDNAGSHASYGGANTLSSGTFADEFHVFSIEWDSTAIRWFLDGVQYHVIDITSAGLSEFQEEFFFIFNVAVGGNWPGSPDSSTFFPQRMLVDHVRVFEKLP